MKKTILILAVIAASLVAQAQENQITQTETTLSDLKTMLEAEGYETFSFDLKSLIDGQYEVSVVAKEFADGQEVGEEILFSAKNKTMISEFSEDDQKAIIEEGIADDPEHGVYRQSDRIQIAFFPISQEGKSRGAMISFHKMGTNRSSFALKTVKGRESEICRYYVRPFTAKSFTESEFHPLLFLGSVWYDSRYNIFRFCGAKEIAHNLSSKILKDCPHYFVIGIKAEKIK